MLLAYTKCTILQEPRESRLPPHSSGILRLPAPEKWKKFTKAVWAREVRPGVMVPHSKSLKL